MADNAHRLTDEKLEEMEAAVCHLFEKRRLNKNGRNCQIKLYR